MHRPLIVLIIKYFWRVDGIMKNNIKRLSKKRWIILIFSCLINLCIGSIYAWSVFSISLLKQLNYVASGGQILKLSNLSIVFTVANAVGPVTMISGGGMNDKFGPKWIVFIGGLLFGSGMILSAYARSIMGLVVGYGLGCGLGMGMVYGCTINNSVKFFPEKRGIIGGIATATYGLSAVVIPPVANLLLDLYGIKYTFIILGIVFIFIISLSSFIFEACPKDFYPYGYENINKSLKDIKSGDNKDWKAMLRDSRFYLMLFILLCGAFSGLMITSQASPIGQKLVGLNAAEAAGVVSILAFFNAGGRIFGGLISDKLGRLPILMSAFMIELLGLILLLFTGVGQEVIFIVAVSLIGLSFGIFMGVYPGFTADEFGSRNNSVNYGFLFTGFAMAGFFGPTSISKVLDLYDSYYPVFYISIGIVLIGLLLGLIFKILKKRLKYKKVQI